MAPLHQSRSPLALCRPPMGVASWPRLPRLDSFSSSRLIPWHRLLPTPGLGSSPSSTGPIRAARPCRNGWPFGSSAHSYRHSPSCPRDQSAQHGHARQAQLSSAYLFKGAQLSSIPQSYRVAHPDPNWRAAMEPEYSTLLSNHTKISFLDHLSPMW